MLYSDPMSVFASNDPLGFADRSPVELVSSASTALASDVKAPLNDPELLLVGLVALLGEVEALGELVFESFVEPPFEGPSIVFELVGLEDVEEGPVGLDLASAMPVPVPATNAAATAATASGRQSRTTRAANERHVQLPTRSSGKDDSE